MDPERHCIITSDQRVGNIELFVSKCNIKNVIRDSTEKAKNIFVQDGKSSNQKSSKNQNLIPDGADLVSIDDVLSSCDGNKRID